MAINMLYKRRRTKSSLSLWHWSIDPRDMRRFLYVEEGWFWKPVEQKSYSVCCIVFVLLAYVSRSSDDNIIALTISCKNVWRLSIRDKSLRNRSVSQMGIPDVLFQRILLTKSGILEKLRIISYSIPRLDLNLIVKNFI